MLGNLWRGEIFPWYAAITNVRIFLFFFIFCPTSVAIMWRICVYYTFRAAYRLYMKDRCYQIKLRVKHFYTNREQCEALTGRHKFPPPWNNFQRFLLRIGLQTRMCVSNVYITRRLGDTSWYFSWMAKNRNLGLDQKFFYAVDLFLIIYVTETPRMTLSQNIPRF